MNQRPLPYLHRVEDGLHVDLVVTGGALVVEDLLGVGLPAQQFHLVWGDFAHTDKPLNQSLLLLVTL